MDDVNDLAGVMIFQLVIWILCWRNLANNYCPELFSSAASSSYECPLAHCYLAS
jgi:hypothetical protein